MDLNCIELAKDGIHAVLVVFSVRTRFTREEEGVLQKLQNYFGEKITMSLLFSLVEWW